jgi:peptidoglycan/LPS O-acetylase OafA/YrhL
MQRIVTHGDRLHSLDAVRAFALLAGVVLHATMYVADASYWIYLAHLPVVFFLQVAVQDAPLHWTIKFPFILIAAFGLLFVSYHYLVRPTWVGAVLNGRRYPRRTTPEPRLSHTV